jgi:hypothetical protein
VIFKLCQPSRLNHQRHRYNYFVLVLPDLINEAIRLDFTFIFWKNYPTAGIQISSRLFSSSILAPKKIAFIILRTCNLNDRRRITLPSVSSKGSNFAYVSHSMQTSPLTEMVQTYF